jgi:lysophospholipase L1-like esterase
LKPNLNQVVWDFTMVSTNSDGLRQPSEIESKKSDTLRIVCLGDSVTFGYRVPVVWADKPNNYDRNALPYPQWLEKQLRAANPGKKIETITLAVPGYSSYQGLLWLKDKIDDLDPDIVIACFGWNDIGTRPVSDKDMMKVGWKDVTLRRLMSVSQAVTHLTEWLNKKRGKDAGNVQQTVGPFVQRVSKEDYVSNFLEMSKLAKERKISFVAVGPVYRDSVSNAAEANLIASYRNALREKMAEAGTPYWEIKELLESNYPETEKLFGEAIHPNNIGHQVIANSLSSFLSSQGMLTKK